MERSYQKTVDKIYNKKTVSQNRDKKIVTKPAKPYHVFSGPNQGLYSVFTISVVYKAGIRMEKMNYLSKFLSGFVIGFFSKPEKLRPVTDKADPKYEDTLEYDSENQTFRVKRHFVRTDATKVMVVVVAKIGDAIVPGSGLVLHTPKYKKMNRDEEYDDPEYREYPEAPELTE